MTGLSLNIEDLATIFEKTIDEVKSILEGKIKANEISGTINGSILEIFESEELEVRGEDQWELLQQAIRLHQYKGEQNSLRDKEGKISGKKMTSLNQLCSKYFPYQQGAFSFLSQFDFVTLKKELGN